MRICAFSLGDLGSMLRGLGFRGLRFKVLDLRGLSFGGLGFRSSSHRGLHFRGRDLKL